MSRLCVACGCIHGCTLSGCALVANAECTYSVYSNVLIAVYVR